MNNKATYWSVDQYAYLLTHALRIRYILSSKPRNSPHQDSYVTIVSSVLDPHWFYANQDRTLNLNTDPCPDPDPCHNIVHLLEICVFN
jgi:hypothetical protein